jgi:ribosomal protein S18 acetylase RimI-like enzyme
VSRVEIREALAGELEEAGRITADAYREFVPPDDDGDWTSYLVEIADVSGRAERTTILVAVEDGRVLGSLTLELDRRVSEGEGHREGERLPAHEAHIRMLGVDPAAQGRGIGRALMDEAIRIARERGKALMTLNTTRRMKSAQRMYESMGFERDPDWQVDEDFVLLTYRLALASSD